MRRGERGEVGLVQLLVSTAVFAVVLTAVLVTFETFVANDRELNARNDAQQQARTGLERIARDLRNLASPTPARPDALDRAQPTDLVFKTVDPNGPNAGANETNVQRVRYCLDSSNASNAKVWVLVQTWTDATAPDMPADPACGAQVAGWTLRGVLVENVTNNKNGQSRPLFTYNSATLADITSIHADLFVDLDAARSPKETAISTGVFLRNQNRRPTASFTWSTSLHGIVLNGSASADPEGQPLEYYWYDGDDPDPVGEGITFTYPADKGSTHTITLKVKDPADLEGSTTITGVTA